MVDVERTVGDVRCVQSLCLLPQVVEHCVGKLGRVGVDGACAARVSLDEERRARAGGSRDDDVGDVHAAPGREQQRVRLVLDVFESGQVEPRPTILVDEEAPQLRHELRVGFVASEHAQVEWPVVVLGEHQGRAPGLTARELDVVGRDAELFERGPDLRARGPSTRRAEREVHRGTDAPAEDHRRKRAVGKRDAQVEGADRHQQDEQLPEPARRAGEERRRSRDDRDDDRDRYHRERR